MLRNRCLTRCVNVLNNVRLVIKSPDAHTQEDFQKQHDLWNQSIILHPMSHILLAMAHRKDKVRVCQESYLALCAPFATLYQRLKNANIKVKKARG